MVKRNYYASNQQKRTNEAFSHFNENEPWCCCHFKAWPIKATKREAGTKFTSAAMAEMQKDKSSIQLIKFIQAWNLHIENVLNLQCKSANLLTFVQCKSNDMLCPVHWQWSTCYIWY